MGRAPTTSGAHLFAGCTVIVGAAGLGLVKPALFPTLACQVYPAKVAGACWRIYLGNGFVEYQPCV